MTKRCQIVNEKERQFWKRCQKVKYLLVDSILAGVAGIRHFLSNLPVVSSLHGILELAVSAEAVACIGPFHVAVNFVLMNGWY